MYSEEERTFMKVIVTGMVPRAGLNKLYDNFEVTYSEGKPYTRQQVLSLLPDMDGVLLMGEQADREFINAGTRLKIIAVNGVGYDNVDIIYAREKGIVVCNSPMSVQEPTAELTICLMLAAARRVGNYDRNLRRGIWQNVSDEAEMGFCLYGSTLGIVGLGRIGRAVAKRARALGMHLIYCDPVVVPREIEKELGVKKVDFDELVERADVITIHTPLTESTRHLFGEVQFQRMKHTAFIVNAARGPIIDEAALINALQKRMIAGAGLDVFEHEPEVPRALLELENVTMTPHSGTGCLSSRTLLAGETAGNIIAVLVDRVPKNVVN
jgi:D-3-phosphoglycerate dehydrogenase